MKKLKKYLNSSLGQSTVEYIMLTAVIVTIMLGILKSKPFQDIFGEDSEFFSTLGSSVEFGYRHGFMASRAQIDADNMNYTGNSVTHASYYSIDSGETRFFIALEPYPQ